MERTLMWANATRLGYKDEMARYMAQLLELGEMVKERTKDITPQIEMCKREIEIRRGAIIGFDKVIEYAEKRRKVETAIEEREKTNGT